MGNILIIEDDINIRKLVSVNLEKRGYGVSEAGNGYQAMSMFREKTYDLVILDLVLPDMPGVDICVWIRARSVTPIIVLSGMRDEELKVKALDAGADDYITKPFGHDELLARVRAMLRRVMPSAAENIREQINIDGLSIDFQTRRVRVGDEDIALTKIEYALLVELAIHPDAVVDHNTLLARVGASVPRRQSLSAYLPRKGTQEIRDAW
jgi:two-component system KDP operon response regulator KdpE